MWGEVNFKMIKFYNPDEKNFYESYYTELVCYWSILLSYYFEDKFVIIWQKRVNNKNWITNSELLLVLIKIYIALNLLCKYVKTTWN